MERRQAPTPEVTEVIARSSQLGIDVKNERHLDDRRILSHFDIETGADGAPLLVVGARETPPRVA